MSTTARPRCSTPSARRRSRRGKPAASPKGSGATAPGRRAGASSSWTRPAPSGLPRWPPAGAGAPAAPRKAHRATRAGAPAGPVTAPPLERGGGRPAPGLAKTGRLGVGASVVAGNILGEGGPLLDEGGQKKKKAGPATPAVVTGLPDV